MGKKIREIRGQNVKRMPADMNDWGMGKKKMNEAEMHLIERHLVGEEPHTFLENAEFLRTASYAQVTEKLYDKSVYRFRHYRKHFDQAVAILRPVLSRLGYTAD